MKPKKRFFDTVVGRILKVVISAIIKNQKGVKGKNEDIVDEIIKPL